MTQTNRRAAAWKYAQSLATSDKREYAALYLHAIIQNLPQLPEDTSIPLTTRNNIRHRIWAILEPRESP